MRASRAFAILVAMALLAAVRAHAEPCTVTLPAGGDIQKALDAMPDAGPATLCLGGGEFRLHRFVSIGRDDLTLRGEGPSTLLKLEPGVESPLIVVGDYQQRAPLKVISHVTIEKLRLVGQGADGVETFPDRSYLTNSAVVVRAGRDVVIRELEVSACRSACILTEYDTKNVSIENDRIGGSVWDGIALNRTSAARIVGNTIRDNTAAGITAEHLEDSVIRDNTVVDNKTHGIYLSDSYRNAIGGNRFSGNVLSGVFLTCAVRYGVAPVLCWEDSMSRANVFEQNQFVDNRVAFMVAADSSANCTKPGFEPNLSRSDLFARNSSEEPDWATYGRCLRYDLPRQADAPEKNHTSPAMYGGGP